MAKLGAPYEKLVADVMARLHKGADVKIGEWVTGPDGEREVDVSVRGTIDGEQTFILVECKDWKSPVGIGAIDALESKRNDLGADKTILASNSGFTAPALRKAERKSIACVSAMVDGEHKIRIEVNRVLIAKRLSVEKYSPIIFFPQDHLDPQADIRNIEFYGNPLTAWLRDRSKQLLQENEDALGIRTNIAFKAGTRFTQNGKTIPILGVGLIMECRKTYIYQNVKEIVSKGFYDCLKKTILIPPNEAWSFIVDQEAWKAIPSDDWIPVWKEPEPNSIEVRLTLFNCAFADTKASAPLLDKHIEEQETYLGPIDWANNAQAVQLRKSG